MSIQNNNINSNLNGVLIYASSGGESGQVRIAQNNINSNHNTGIYLERVINSWITNNNFNNNQNGLIATAVSNSFISTNLFVNTISNAVIMLSENADRNNLIRNSINGPIMVS